MKFLTVVFLMWAAVAQAQWTPWNQYQLLSNDTASCGSPDFAVDDSFRLHVFYVRTITPYLPALRCLHYQRFDNWGNPLSSPFELAPDTASHEESTPGVLLDRNGILHVVWLRWYSYLSGRAKDVYYARMNVNGEFLTPPCTLPYESTGIYPATAIDLVQDCTGVVWVTCGKGYGAVTETGQLLKPLRDLTDNYETWIADNPRLARTPNDEIWGCSRVVGSEPQTISMARLDTTVQQLEVVSPNNPNHEIFGMSMNSFLVDDTGVFHYILYRDDCGIFYQRDPRNGQPVDTVILDRLPSGTGDARLTMAGDTLVYLWGRGAGFWRVGISLSGEIILGPVFVPLPSWNPTIVISDLCRLIWKAGSYWLVISGNMNQRGQIYMIHVPGPNEPLNVVSQKWPLPTDLSLRVYPNPLNPSGRIAVNLLQRGLCTIDLFDVLGRHTTTIANSVFEPGRYEFTLDARDLPTGTYFVHLRTAGSMQIRKAVVIK